MDTPTVTPPVTPAPPDPLSKLRANVYGAISKTAEELGAAPWTMTLSVVDGRRYGSMHFESINDAGRWADWLHWAYATRISDGQMAFTAYGQWLGWSWQIIATEPAQLAEV